MPSLYRSKSVEPFKGTRKTYEYNIAQFLSSLEMEDSNVHNIKFDISYEGNKLESIKVTTQ